MRALVLILCAAGVLAPPAAAWAGTGGRDVPVAGPLPSLPASVPDRVIAGAPARASSGPARTRSYRTPDGQRVEVATSSAYPLDIDADRKLVEFLATRAHGRELGSISLFVGKPDEVSRLCGGGGAIACYAIAEQRMYVPGEDTAGVPIEYAITHEYGHHVASSRRNDPWDALDWGPKHWASAVGVCAAVERRRLWPGDQGRHYASDPGEGFADGYAHLHYPDAPWRYDPLMRPDADIRDAIRRDVENPWAGPRTRVVRRATTLRLALDGEVVVRVRAPRSARYEVTLGTRDWAERQVLRGGQHLGMDVCRPRGGGRVQLTVTARRLAGAGAVEVRYPG